MGQAAVSAALNPRLKALGFRHDPFAYFEAERMPADVLEETFVAHPGFDEYIMDLDRSAVLLAPRGGGKTAGRLRLTTHLNRRRQQTLDGVPIEDGPPYTPLVVTYNDFERIIDRLPAVDLRDHAKPLLAAVAKASYSFIAAHPKGFMALSVWERDWWWAFLETCLEGESLDYRLQGSSLVPDWQRWKRTAARQAPFRPGSALQDIFESLQKRLNSLGLDRLFVLVDGVDGYLQTQSVPNVEALVVHLLNTLSLLSLGGVVWKFFLPDILEKAVRDSAGYQTGRLNLVRIKWDTTSLIALLRLRLQWASDYLVPDMGELCDMDLRAIDVEQELARMALRHSRLGPPRALLDLGNQLFQKEAEGSDNITIDG